MPRCSQDRRSDQKPSRVVTSQKPSPSSPGVFASTMTDGLVAVAETRKPGVDAILVSIDVRAFGDGLLDDRRDGRWLDIGQHPDHHLAAALDHAEDRWLFLLQGTAATAAL